MNTNKTKVALSLCIALGLTACGGGGDEDGSGGAGGAGGAGGSGSSGSLNNGDVTFNLTGAVSVVTTEEAASVTKSQSKSFFGETLPQLTFGAQGAVAKSSTEPVATNLFTMDDQGQLQSALQSTYLAKISYTVQSKDGKYLYAVLDSESLWDWNYQELISKGNCAIFKIDTKSSDWSCLVEGHIAEKPQGYWDEINDGRFKPLQLDDAGNVYFLSRTFKVIDDGYGYTQVEFDYDGSASPLVRVNPENGSVKTLTTDSNYISSFLVTQGNSLIYRAEKLKMIPDLTPDKPSTVPLENNAWSSGWYTVDDHNTVIYTPDYNNDKIQFAQPSDEHAGGIEKRTVDTYKLDTNSWLRRVIMGDDGFVYGVYNSSQTTGDGDWSEYAKLQRILPYAPGEIVSVRMPSDNGMWWHSQQMQVAKGHVYYIEEEVNHNYGQRDVIGVTRIVDGKAVKLFAGEWATERYDIESWKLAGDIIYFTGLDSVTSEMISGQIDTAKLNQGMDQNEYLTVNKAASVYGDSLTIHDMEVLRPVRPENSGGNPEVMELMTSDEDIYSSTLKFNKWMDPSSVEQALTVSETTGKDTPEVATVDTMVVWLGRMAHLLYDTDNDSSKPSAPLEFGKSYRAFIGADARDSDGFSLISEQLDDAERTFDWTVREESGMKLGEYGSTSTLTDGNILKFFNGTLQAKAFDSVAVASLDYQVELTTSLKNEFSLDLIHNNNDWSASSIRLDYSPWNKELRWNDDWSTNETITLDSHLVKFAVRLSEVDGNVEYSVTVTAENGDTNTFKKSVAKPFSGLYKFEYSSRVEGFNSGMMDNFKVIEAPESETPTVSVEEAFDTLPAIDGSTPFTFTSNISQ